MKMIFGLAVASIALSACGDMEGPTGTPAENTQVYQTQMARLSDGMSFDEVSAILGEPRFAESHPTQSKRCGLWPDMAADGRDILHEVQFENDMMVVHVVGIDTGLAACAPA